jgi:hypothetical protein
MRMHGRMGFVSGSLCTSVWRHVIFKYPIYQCIISNSKPTLHPQLDCGSRGYLGSLLSGGGDTSRNDNHGWSIRAKAQRTTHTPVHVNNCGRVMKLRLQTS